MEQGLRAKFEAAVAKAIAAVGVDGVTKADVVKRFASRGIHLATLYRWFDAYVATGKPGQAAVRAVKAAAKARAAMPPGPSVEIIDEARALLPVAVRLEEVTGAPTVRIIEELGVVVADLKALVKHAKGPDGTVRNARLLLSACDRVRACMETALKIQAAMRSVDEVDRLQAAMIAEIAKCDRDLAERVIRAM
jgi:hypothetical protein